MKARRIYIETQLLQCICHLSGAIITDRDGVQTMRQPKPAVTDFGLLLFSRIYMRLNSNSLLVCRFYVLNLRNICKYMDCYLFADPERWKAELADPYRTVYAQNCHLSTLDRPLGREILPAKDRHHHHWAIRYWISLLIGFMALILFHFF